MSDKTLKYFDSTALDFDLEAENSFLDFVAAGGIHVVFHKHTLIFYSRHYYNNEQVICRAFD